MLSPEIKFGIAMLVIVLMFAYAMGWLGGGTPKPTAVPAKSPQPTPNGTGRALIDVIEETGKNAAGAHVEDRLGKQKAAEIFRGLAAAFTDPAVNVTVTPSPVAAPVPNPPAATP